MKFIGMSKEDRKLVLEALELVSRARFECLDACKPRAGMPDTKPEVIAAYEADIKAIETLYDAARVGDATCEHPNCGGKIIEVVCDNCKST
jgi:hypothetical protein